jgi:hypothetical protein
MFETSRDRFVWMSRLVSDSEIHEYDSIAYPSDIGRLAGAYKLPSSDANCHLPPPQQDHAAAISGTISRLRMEFCDLLHVGLSEPGPAGDWRKGSLLFCSAKWSLLAHSVISTRRKIWSLLVESGCGAVALG